MLALVEQIPTGKVMSYGAMADALAEVSGRNSARQIGAIMARHGGAVAWHRVVSSTGRLPPGHESQARERLLADGVPLIGDRVNMTQASWLPPAQ